MSASKNPPKSAQQLRFEKEAKALQKICKNAKNSRKN